jgi:LmbE family N-acetylglucosaminyl deacetylase
VSASPEGKTVLAIGAHPGAVECLCAGTLALLHERGWRVVVATMTSGVLRAKEQASNAGHEDRLSRAQRAAAVLDAEFHCMQGPGFNIFFSDAPCRQTTGLVRAARPSIVLTHSALDPIHDHEETSRIVRQACFSAPQRSYATTSSPGGREPLPRAPHLYYFDPLDGKDFLGRPVRTALVVDVSSTMDAKQRMVALHDDASGRQEQGALVSHMRTRSQQRGQEAGCADGEGFRQHVGEAYPHDDLLQQTLGKLVHVVSRD